MVDQLTFAVSPTAKAPTKGQAADPDPLKGGDVYKWALEQAAHIRAGRFDDVDLINVADEIESLGNSEFRSLASNLEIVLVHILKWDFQKQKRSRSWIRSIDEHRERVSVDLGDSPSLKRRLDDAIQRGYKLARHGAAKETKLALKTFPDTCPYSQDEIFNRTFVLDQTDAVS